MGHSRLEYNRLRMRQIRKRRLEAGQCGHCGNQSPAEGRTTCDDCLEKNRKYHRDQIAAGKCVNGCGRLSGPDDQRCRECAEKERRRKKKASRELKQEVIAHYGGRCACCGEDRLEFMNIDHINGGGKADRRRFGNNHRFYRWLRNHWPTELRVLCSNCNSSLGLYGYCPHQP